jgi:hypothetical protein
MPQQKRNETAKEHLLPGQSQKYVTPQTKDQTRQDKSVKGNHRMGLNYSAKNKQGGKNDFNSQPGLEDFPFFSIKKPRKQTRSKNDD